jgi:deazaflavin-dependent oxidoreductase (nitroreductase family)
MDAAKNSMTTPPVQDSPVGWIKDHIDAYVASNGAEGHIWNGVPSLLLTTRGRTTGMPRRTGLFYGRSDASYVVVASNGGDANDPQWLLNLRAAPGATVQVGAEVLSVIARETTAAARPDLWQQMVGLFAGYAKFEAEAAAHGRVIALVLLDPQ